MAYINPKEKPAREALEIIKWLENTVSNGKDDVAVDFSRPLQKVSVALTGIINVTATSGNALFTKLIEGVQNCVYHLKNASFPRTGGGLEAAPHFHAAAIKIEVTKDDKLNFFCGSELLFIINPKELGPIKHKDSLNENYNYEKLLKEASQEFKKSGYFYISSDSSGYVTSQLKEALVKASQKLIEGKVQELEDVILANGLSNPAERWAPPSYDVGAGTAKGGAPKAVAVA